MLIERTARHRPPRPKRYERIHKTLLKVLVAKDKKQRIELYASRIAAGLPVFGR